MRSFKNLKAQRCSLQVVILLLLSAGVHSKRSSRYWTNGHEIAFRGLDSVNSTAEPTINPTSQPSALNITYAVYCEFAALLGLQCTFFDDSAQLCGDTHITCNPSDLIIGLSYAALSGVFPSLFTELLTLEFMSITDSVLSGSLPIGIGNLVSLTSLTIANVGISGSIPQTLSKLLSLKLLDLSENKLTSTIPAFLGTLPYLNTLDLAGNSFTGVIPSSLCTSNITTLNISGNSGALCYPPCLLTSNITVDLMGAFPCTSSPTTSPTAIPTTKPTSQSLCIELDMYDNFGDGWDTASLLIYSSDGGSKSYGLPCGESHYSTSHCFDVDTSKSEDFVMVHVVGYKPKYEWDIFWQATNGYDEKVYLGNSQTELIFVFYKSLDSSGNSKYSIQLEVAEELASHPDNCKQYREKVSQMATNNGHEGKEGGTYNTTYTTLPAINGTTVYNNISTNSTLIFNNGSSSNNSTSNNSSNSSYNNNNKKSLLTTLSNDKQSVAKGTLAPKIIGSSSSSSSSSSMSDNNKNLVENKNTISSTFENIVKGNGKRALSLSDHLNNNNNNQNPRSLKSELLSSSSKSNSNSKSKSFNRKSNGPVTPSAAYFDLMGTWNSKYSEDFDINYYISNLNGQKLLYTGTKCSTPFDPSDNYKLQYDDGEYIWRVDGILSENKDDIEWDFCDYIGGVSTELFFKISKGKCYPQDILTLTDICDGDEVYYESYDDNYNVTDTMMSEKLVTLVGKIQIGSVSPSTLTASDIQLLSDTLIEEVILTKLALKVITDRTTLTYSHMTSSAITTATDGRKLEDNTPPLTVQQQQELIHEAEEEKEDKEAMKYAHVLEFSLPLLPSSRLTNEIENVADIQQHVSHALSSKLVMHKVHSTATRRNLPNLQGITSISLVDFHVLHNVRENVWLSDVSSVGIFVGGTIGMMFVVLVAAYIIRTNRRQGSLGTRRGGYGPAYQLSELDNTLNSIDANKLDSANIED